MIHTEHINKPTDDDLIIEFSEDLIKEMMGITGIDRKGAIHAASITSKRLAHETAQKFYYEVTQYLIYLND